MTRTVIDVLNRQKYDVIVVGAGPAGMMAAGTSAKRGLRVILLEKNSKVGRKLMITGKGRCNVTNNSEAQKVIASTPGNGKFLYGAVTKFPPSEVMRFFEEMGVLLKTERGNRVFPQSDKASDIVDALREFVLREGVKIRTQESVSNILVKDGKIFGVRLQNEEKLFASNVIIACGGASYPATGSTGDGCRIARMAGHTITPLRPSLVSLRSDDADCAQMQGLSLKNCSVQVYDMVKKRKIYEDFGEMLFTHFGVSGPLILSASAHMRQMNPGRYIIHIDLKPALSPEQLDLRLQRDLSKNANRDFDNSLEDLLPKKMIPVIIARSGISAKAKCNAITREERLRFGTLLKDFTVSVAGFRSLEEAIVTSGGVSVKEVNPKTMESKIISGLYFAGEVLDVDAYTGGFNLQAAFSTGYLAGSCVKIGGNEECTQ